MRIYLIRHADADPSRSPSPYAVPLTAVGREQARAIAQQCVDWELELLCTSTMLSSQETADVVSERLPTVERWDLEELDDMNTDDLMGTPDASPLVAAWRPEQLRLGRERTWIRVTAWISRLLVYASSHRIERVAVVAGETVLAMMLLNWYELDWRALEWLSLRFDVASSTLVCLADGTVEIAWANRPVSG